MKAKSFLAFLLGLLPAAIWGQTWLPDGATWHHAYQDGFGASGYVRMEVAGDTLVLGQPARKLARARIFTDLVSGVNYSGSLPTLAAYENDGLAMIHVPEFGVFDTLCHINAVPGDHWRIPRLPGWRLCGDDSFIQVLDTGTIVVSGLLLRQLIIEVHFLLGGEPTGLVLPDTIIERIGTTSSYFLVHDECNGQVDGQEAGALRCYSDSLIEYESGIAPSCDFTTSITDSWHVGGSFHVWPNPGTDVLHIEPGIAGRVVARIMDCTGRLVQSIPLGPGSPLELGAAKLAPGVYWIEVNNTEERKCAKWVKQ